eukprot:g23669.t1
MGVFVGKDHTPSHLRNDRAVAQCEYDCFLSGLLRSAAARDRAIAGWRFGLGLGLGFDDGWLKEGRQGYCPSAG